MVADFSRVLAGPFATMLLGDLGADVVKVEHPDGGDETRAWGPPFSGGHSTYYLAVNRNKRSVALDLKSDQGRRAARALAARADVVVENFKAGAPSASGSATRRSPGTTPAWSGARSPASAREPGPSCPATTSWSRR